MAEASSLFLKSSQPPTATTRTAAATARRNGVKRIKGRAPLDGDDARCGKTRRRGVRFAPNNRPAPSLKAAAMNALIARLACSFAVVVAVAVVVAGLAAAPAAQAQGTNAGKPIHIVGTFTPGGAPDLLARLL